MYVYIYRTKSTKQRPWETNSRSDKPSYKVYILWNPKADYHVHQGPQLGPILSKMNPLHILTFWIFNPDSELIVLNFLHTNFSTCLTPFRFSDEHLFAFLISTMSATIPAPPSFAYPITAISSILLLLALLDLNMLISTGSQTPQHKFWSNPHISDVYTNPPFKQHSCRKEFL